MTENEPQKENNIYTNLNGGIEAHIIADMLRIESITTELQAFKTSNNQRFEQLDKKIDKADRRFDKLENWIVGIVGVTVTTLMAVVAGIIVNAVN
jgi:hypothetical protein